MRILITISHPSHANFFKEAAKILRKNNHDVFISTLDRGSLVKIVDKEYLGFEKFVAGKHKGNGFSIIFSVNILRFLKLLKFVFSNEIDFGISVGSFTSGAAMRMNLKPNVQFDDDPERGISTILEKITGSRLYYPPIVEHSKKIRTFNALKEWAHLSPEYFTPDVGSLDEFGLIPKEYILIRDISTGSLNYRKQNPDIILNLVANLPENIKVVLSLENKSDFKKYPEEWIILNEPVMDFYSLMYYSKLVISSGDSIPRESAILGVPGIYCGFREMKANDILMKKGLVFHSKPSEVNEIVRNILDGKIIFKEQESVRNELRKEWEDVTELIVNIVNDYDKKK